MDFDDEEVDERSCGGMAEFCCRYKDSLNDREAAFDQQMKARTTLGGRISPKQQAWLEIILWKTEPPKSLRCLAWILAEQREFRLCHLAPMAFVFPPLGYAHLRQRVRAIFGTHPHPFFLPRGEIRISEAISCCRQHRRPAVVVAASLAHVSSPIPPTVLGAGAPPARVFSMHERRKLGR
ncbi:hypothetical protein [Mesorhizobium sp.]|uniref:hypothetical protein n=1 Tax=Mesorhizobium sp. TaxID=1871066 RepID=UPI000FE4F091|nr:hypothetical protein [Mesorhizobium sp.]RWE98572.1 MAG: hypothetical protein EOS43_17290 [Mesorhizobium sp.]